MGVRCAKSRRRRGTHVNRACHVSVVVGPFVGHHYHRGRGRGRCRGRGRGRWVVVDVVVWVMVVVVGCCRIVVVVVVVVGGVLKETGDVTCHRKLLINKHGHVDASDHVMYPSTCSYVM